MGSCLSVSSNREPDPVVEQMIPPRETSQVDDSSSSVIICVQQCRMCMDKQTSANDPVMQLGCKCLGDMSFAHLSCIRKWFPTRSVNSGVIDCEICNEMLEGKARSIVKSEIRSKVLRYFFYRGVARVGQAIGRTFEALAAGVQSFNNAMEVGIWECFH